jgi:hypothetical protein
MRKFYYCCTPLLLSTLLYSLPGSSQNQMTLANREGSNLSQFERTISGRPVLEYGADIQGTAFYSNDWTPGLVQFKDGKVAKGLPLRFNVHNNKVYFQREENQLEFAEPVRAFWLGMDSNTAVLFRNGYTPIDKNDGETFYEVMANGKVQLLKYRQKLLREFSPLNMPKEKRFEDVDALYVFLPNYRIEKIKKNKNDILKALPEYADAINKILEANKLNLKNEEALVTLFRELNKE